MKNTNPLYTFLENNQTISNPKHNARQFGRRYWKSGKKLSDSENGIYHIYRSVKDKDGNTIKVKRIKKEYPKEEDNSKNNE